MSRRPRLDWPAGPALARMTTAEAAIRAFFGELSPSPARLAWMDRGRCAETDPEIFYPENGSEGINDAKQVCAQCPVQQQCREYALENDERHGVWGGLSEGDRDRLRRAAARPRLPRRTITPAELEQFAALRAMRLSYDMIAGRMGIPERRVYTIARRARQLGEAA